MPQLRKNEITSLQEIFRKGFRHMARNSIVKVGRDGNVSGRIIFLKLDKDRRVLDMAQLPFSTIEGA
jgi:hypothetical protein